MSLQELAYSVIDGLSEEKLRAFLTLFADDNTLAQMGGGSSASDRESKYLEKFDKVVDNFNMD
ncbi:MAG: hypothetical protein J1F11_10045 [Oscillospiraceae bacterium]|nr:hypothetical protein [Oscillospiraceae bacterium]